MRCLTCATDCPDDATFCGGCGRPFADADPGVGRAFAPGDVIVGSYVVERPLGEGGMGTVYLAADRVSGQRVAVKVLPAALARERDIRERFVREARALAALDHPGIVPLVTFAQDGDDRFLVMKYIAGESLDAVMAREGVLDPERAREILRAMADALDHAHAHGVIHRDVKPGNVLIDPEGRVVVVDFGIARTIDGGRRVTETGMLMGTPQYMSPEQIAGDVVDGRADLYACGLVLFEMLAGAPPWDDGSTFDILRAHVEAPVPDVDARRRLRVADGPPLPADLRALLHALLQKKPEQRPPTGRDVVAILDGTQPLPASPPTRSLRGPGPGSPPAPRARSAVETPSLAFSDDRDDLEPLAAIRRPLWPVVAAAALGLGVVAAVIVAGDEAPDAVVSAGDAGQSGADTRFEEAVLVARARVALDNGRLDDARIALETAIQLGITSPGLSLTRAELAFARGRRDEAAAGLAALDPDDLAALDETARARARALEARLTPAPAPTTTATTTPPPPRPSPKPSPSPPPAPGPPPVAAEAPVGPQALSDDALAAVTGSTRDRISACYATHILAAHVDAEDGDAKEGVVEVAVDVAPTGLVSRARVTRSAFGQPPLERCIADAVRTWRFPPFSGRPQTLTHAFTLRARR